MTHPESENFHDSFRSIEAEFRGRQDHQTTETTPALITLPDEVTFQQATAKREAQDKLDRERNAAAYQEWREREKREKRIGRLKKAFAVAAIFMTYKSGGLIDMAGDHVTSAGDVAAEALQVQPFEVPDEMDGIPFEDYSQDVQEEIVSEGQVRVEKDTKMKNELVDIFSDLDTNGPEGLLEEVDTYKADHAEKFTSTETTDDTKEQIDNQDSNSDVMATLNNFMKTEYGINASFGVDTMGEEVRFDDRTEVVKDIAKAYVDVFGALPKDFVSLANLETIKISNQLPSGDEEWDTRGRYSPDLNRIQLFVHSPAFNAVLNGAEKIPYVGSMSYQSVVAHELGHALDEKLVLPVTNTEVEAGGMETTEFLEHTARTLVYKSELPSTNAAEDGQEHTAEVLAGILAKESSGLADTNEWRRFGSESNKNMIRMLGQLEEAYPGISKILIANRLSDH